MYFVKEVRVFGSYLDDAPDLGDIDIAVGQRRRPGQKGEDWITRRLARADNSGRSFKSYFDRTTYCQREVIKILTGNSRSFSLHDIDGLDRMGWRSEVLFKLEVPQALDVTTDQGAGQQSQYGWR